MLKTYQASVTHDMRTPLSAVSMLSENMLTQNTRRAEGRKYLKTIYHCSKMINFHVNNLLEYNLMLKNKFKIVPTKFDIREVIKQMIDVMEQKAA